MAKNMPAMQETTQSPGHIRTWEKGAVTPQETEPDLPASIRGSAAEVWVGSGSSQR